MCSTPGGIGAAITMLRYPVPHEYGVLNARRHRGGDHSDVVDLPWRKPCGAQRPEASGRRSRQGHPVPNRTAGCSTPGGIGAAITTGIFLDCAKTVVCSTPGGIGAAITLLVRFLGLDPRVLNARRHRGGDHTKGATGHFTVTGAQRPEASGRRSRAFSSSSCWIFSSCSTPGGIGAAITWSAPWRHRPRCTPSAQRPEASGRRSPETCQPVSSSSRCSTPGGIGAAITWSGPGLGRSRWSAQRPEASGRRSHLSNPAFASLTSAQRPEASGRRSQSSGLRHSVRVSGVLNARRHRGGDHVHLVTERNQTWHCAQRPEASGRRSHPPLLPRHLHHRVLNARRHRGGDHFALLRRREALGLCSTPGGIGAAITRRPGPP